MQTTIDDDDLPAPAQTTLSLHGPSPVMQSSITDARIIRRPHEKTYRVRGIPLTSDYITSRNMIIEGLGCNEDEHGLVVNSLAVDSTGRRKVATISFKKLPDALATGHEWSFNIPSMVIRKSAEFDTDNDDVHQYRVQCITVDNHFLGFTVLYAPSSKDHKVDCIAISGLGGHAFGSFKERGGPHMWLRDALPYDIPSLRTIIYGYDTQLNGSKAFQDLEALGNTLRVTIEAMADISDDVEMKPLLFVAHSLGGLVVKEAIIQMRMASDVSRRILEATYGALFFGVPNQGMDISSLIPMVKDQPNQALLHSLGGDSQLLRNQTREFPVAFDFKDSKIICFYETQMSPTSVQVRR